MKSRYCDPFIIHEAITSSIEQMKNENKFTDKTTFEELCEFAGSRIKIVETHQPERLSEKTSKEDAIV